MNRITTAEIKKALRGTLNKYPFEKDDDKRKEKYDVYIFEDEDNKNQQYRRTKEIQNDLYTDLLYINNLEKELRRFKELPKWVKELHPKADERRNKVSDLFWKVNAELWESALTRQETEKITERLDLPLYSNGLPFVISDPNINKIAKKYLTTPDNIRKQIARWVSTDSNPDAPFFRLGMTKPKNEGGRTIYAIGYWTELRRIPFFTQKRSQEWLRSILFRKR
jgi:hypothetical protein